MTDEAVRDAASRITEAIDHLIAAVQDVAVAIREGTTKPYELPAALKGKSLPRIAVEPPEDEPI